MMKYIFRHFILSAVIVLCSCQEKTANLVDLNKLIIDDSQIPNGWILLSKGNDPIVSFGEEQAIQMLFFYGEDTEQKTRGGITIYQHGSFNDAYEHFIKQENGDFNANNRRSLGPFFIPDDIDVSFALDSDEYHFGCHHVSLRGLLDDTLTCLYLAQYQEYVVYVRVNMLYHDKETLSIEQLEQLLLDTHQHMMQGLNGSSE